MKDTRILIFVQDGSGLGHLSRMSRIAAHLQKEFTVLIVTAKREASWMIPEDCEFVRIPGWRSMRKKLAQHWNRNTWINISEIESIKMISEFNYSIENIFCPDVIITDYLPFGKLGELRKVLNKSSSIKYLILRGIIDTSDKNHYSLDSQIEISNIYNRILVACDSRIIDVVKEYDFIPEISKKIETIGYIATKKYDKKLVRLKNKISVQSKWVVCSSGGGKDSEEFLNHCVKISSNFPNVQFFIIYGPYSRESLRIASTANKNCEIFIERIDLPELLCSCDLAIINGGYNSLMESIDGNAQVLVYPNQIGLDDEQVTHSHRLSKFHSITVLNTQFDLASKINLLLENKSRKNSYSEKLNFMGLKMITKFIEMDIKQKS